MPDLTTSSIDLALIEAARAAKIGKPQLLGLISHPGWSDASRRYALDVLSKAPLPLALVAGPSHIFALVGGAPARSPSADLRATGTRISEMLARTDVEAPWIVLTALSGQLDSTRIQHAERVLDLAPRLCALPRVITDDDCLIWHAIARDDRLRHQLQASVAPLVDERTVHPVLVDTLQIYSEQNLSLEATAKRLKVHRNTIKYRLRQIERILGRSLRCGPDRLTLELAVIAWRLEVERRGKAL